MALEDKPHKPHTPTKGDIYQIPRTGEMVMLDHPVRLDYTARNGEWRPFQVPIEEADADAKTTWIAFADVNKRRNRREVRPGDAENVAFVLSADAHRARIVDGRPPLVAG